MKAIFLDRDGVINEDIHLLYKKEDVIILPEIKKVLSELKNRGFYIIVVTNQPTVARGLITEKGVIELDDYINSKIDNLVDKFYFCPHHPNANIPEYRMICECRKPSPGLIIQASKDLKVNLEESWMIGDMNSDITAGNAAGCKTILIKSSKNKEEIECGKPYNASKPDYIIKNLLEILNIIK